VVFSCNWGGWSCIDAATNAGLHYPASVKVVRLSCLARIHAGLILKAFEFGADGVMLLGCEPGSCHFDSDNMCVSKEYEKSRDILNMLGIWKNRLALVQLPAFDGQQFIAQLMNFLAEVERTPAYRRFGTASSEPA
jgi:coenzyme F420-reducing hydrogenase delta subunit